MTNNQDHRDSAVDEAFAQYQLATQLLERGLSDHALGQFLELIDRAPWLIPAYSGAGAAALENDLFQQTLEIATAGLRLLDATPASPSSVEQGLLQQRALLLCQKAGALSGLGHHQQAIEIAKESYKLYPSGATLIELGNILAFAGKLDEAEEHYGVGLLETESPALATIAYNNMAVLLERQSDFDGALTYFQRACAINPKDSQARIELATALAERGRYDEGLKTLRAISKSDPNYHRSQECLDLIHHGQEMIETTAYLITNFEEQISTTPTAPGYLNLALCYLETKQSIKAIIAMQRGLSLAPDDLALITTLTDTLLTKRLLQLAIPLVKDALINHPENPQLTSLQTLILARTHEHARAHQFFTRTTELLGNDHTTFGQEPWAITSHLNRLLPSALKSYEYLTAAACEMKDWPLAIESLFSGLDLELGEALPDNSEAGLTRHSAQEYKEPALDQANILTAQPLDEAHFTAASLALILYNVDLLASTIGGVEYEPLQLTIEAIMEFMPEAQGILDQMVALQSNAALQSMAAHEATRRARVKKQKRQGRAKQKPRPAAKSKRRTPKHKPN